MTQMLIKSPVAPSGSGFMVFDLRPEANAAWGYVSIDFFPPAPADGGFDFRYESGIEPTNEWYIDQRFTEVQLTGNNQIWAKVDKTGTVSGFQNNLYWNQLSGTPPYGIGVWVDLWDAWELEFNDRIYNGIPEEITITLSIAKDDGGGAPDLATVVVYPMTLQCYRGYKDYLIEDAFGTPAGDLANHTPTLDQRDDGAGDPTSYWRDLYWDSSDFDHGWMYISSSSEVVSQSGSISDEALYVIDAKTTNVQIASRLEWDVTSEAAGGIAGRIQDIANFWLLAVKNPAATDPVLGLYKVVAGSHTLAASKTLTGLGPLTGFNDHYPMRLSFDGNDIMGEIGFSDASVNLSIRERMFLTHTDATFNTETDIGIWADGINTIFLELNFYNWPLGYNPIVWDTTPFSTTVTDTGPIYNNCYFYEKPIGKVAAPYNATMGSPLLNYQDTIDWRSVWFLVDMFVLKASAVSGDTAGITIREYGTTPTAFDVWMDLFRCDIVHEVGALESQTAVIDVTLAVDDGTGNPLAGTEVTKRITFISTSTGT